jgi:hypothetical protein
MGQSGAVGRTERRTDTCRCAGGPTKKYRRPDRPKRVETLDSAGMYGTACLGRAKQEKFLEVRHGSHTQQGQDRELCPILHLIGEVLHCRTPPTPAHPKPKKEKQTQRKQKSILVKGWRGILQKKQRTHQWMQNFRQSFGSSLFPLSIEPPTIGQQ